MDDVLERLRAYLEAHAERHLARVQALLRQPSVSVDGEGVEACAALLAELAGDAGFPEAVTVPTAGYPGVWAAYDASAPVTLVVYGMFDVRRASGAWQYPPFEASVVPMAPFPRVLVARGARAVKGPLAVWLNAVEACRAVLGRPPVNLLLLAEGDEILGSPHYREMVARYRDRLRLGTTAWTPGASQDISGAAHLTLGYKGLIYLTVRVSGSRWGRGPRHGPIHGMTRSVVDSPVWRLIHALASLTTADGNTPLIDGFDRPIGPPTPEEAEEVAALRRRFAGTPWQRVLPGVHGADVPSIDDAPEAEVYNRFFYGASLNINGLRSGYLGPGTLTFTLPHVAEAVLDVRVPRDWSVEAVLAALRARLDAQGFADVELDVTSAFDGSRVSRDAPVVRAAHALFASRGLEVVWWPSTGGGGPWSLFARELGMPVLRDVGLGHGRASATDEYLVVDGAGLVGGMVEMALSHAELMLRLA
jgi:acetylornithine deacetylase/succinyl-diaminopimelate desuccinylase-like protein